MAQGHADDDMLGRVLNGRFRVVARIGSGGMGRVYKAVQEPIDRVVALKVLNPRYDSQKDPGFERRFFLEASMTAKLKHPNTITLHDYGRTDDGIYYIAMEYLEGETLQAVLRRGPISWPRALSMASQIARSLREAHKQGMVHRDLKPANVMVLSEGTGGDVVKVLDFGLVKSFLGEKTPRLPLDDEEDTDGEGAGELTQAGVLLGSPLYMAPEQARSDADGRTDIYALGIVMFQCISGRTPFQGKDSIDILVKQVREKPPELSELMPSTPPEVDELVMRCLQKAPADRYQSMDELLEAIRAILNDQGFASAFGDPRAFLSPESETAPSLVVIQADPRGPPPTRPTVPSIQVELSASQSRLTRRRSWRVPVIMGSVVLLALGATFFWWRARPAPPADTVSVAVPPGTVKKEAPLAPVVFDVDSEPSGARVMRDGVFAGVTPFSFTMTRPSDDVARAELSFELEGYEVANVVVQGSDGTVPVRPVLKKLSGAKPSRPVKPPKPNPPGYKDDPYQ